MHLAIVQTKDADVEAFLTMLDQLFPPSLTKRAELTDQSLETGTLLPRIIARAFDVTEDEFEAGMRVMEKIGAPNFEVRGYSGPGGAPVQPASDAEVLATGANHLGRNMAPQAAEDDPEADAVMKRVLKPEASGVDFPEKSYPKKEKAVYNYIVKKLGKEPYKDQGDTLNERAVRDIPRPPRKFKKETWDAVVDHLETELRYFRFARGWFSDNGHLRVLYRDQTVFDYDFVDRLNTDYGLLKSNLEVSVSLDVAVNLATDAIKQASGPVGWAIGFLWGLTKDLGNLPNGVMSGAIAELHRQVADEFAISIQVVEKAYVSICEDWGNLEAFGYLVDAERLKWPKDAGPIRRAHAKGFHFAGLRSLLNLKSKTESYQSAGYRTTFGIITETEHTDNPVSEGWNSGTGRYRMASQKGPCDRNYNYAYLLGRKDCAFVEKSGWGCHPAWDAKIELVRKLFGTEGTDKDPQLSIDPRFLKDANIRKNLGFSLHTAS